METGNSVTIVKPDCFGKIDVHYPAPKDDACSLECVNYCKFTRLCVIECLKEARGEG